MKIKLKLSSDELVTITNVLQRAYERGPQQAYFYNVVHSIALDLADAFDTKTKNRIKKGNIFDSRKKTEITLKYHEAWALKIYLRDAASFTANDFQRTILNKQVGIIDQQLQ